FYGEPGSGKTNICLMAALDCAKKDGKILYIDSEGGFSAERFKQLTPEWKTHLDKIKIIEPKTFEEQGKLIRGLGKHDADLIIVDSMVALYRLEYADRMCKKNDGKKNIDLVMEANRELSKQLSLLSAISREKGIPVLITTHTFRHWDKGTNELVGGDAIRYWSKIIVLLEKTGRMSERRATVIKHQYVPELGQAKFDLTQNGIKPSGFRIF
ncbi:MAG: AAA family ATPase, partial [Deltaproteobacteria bacterium]|nr:AAA family ATPase [Deltaproteobacteria bacterium]